MSSGKWWPSCLGLNVLRTQIWSLFTNYMFAARRHTYAAVNWANIGSGNGLAPVRRQAITWIIADLLSIGSGDYVYLPPQPPGSLVN